MTARSITLTHDTSSSATTAMTWEVAFPTPVQFTSYVTDILTADTYSLKIDGSTVVSGVVATAAQTGVTFTPGSPVSLTAGVHTFQLIGTASRAYYCLASNVGAATGDSAYAILGVWQESATRQVPGTINFTEDGSVLPAGMERNTSTGTARTGDTWDVTFDTAVSFTGFLWLAQATTGTYKLTIDGVDVATGITVATKRFADFRPSSPVALSSGTHTFSITAGSSLGAFYRNTATPLLGSSHVTTWAVWSEGGGTSRVAGLMGFALSSGTATSGSGSLSLSGSGSVAAPAGASGALALSGSGVTSQPASGSGSLSLSGSGTADVPGSGGSGSLSLSGSGVTSQPASGSGALSLSGSADTSAAAAGSGSLSLSGSGVTAATAGGSGALSFSGTGTASLPAGGAGSLTLSGSGTVAALLSYSATVLGDGPDGYWHLDETSGTTAFDSATVPHDGVYYGSPHLNQLAAIPDGSAVGFNTTLLSDMEVPHWAGLDVTEFSLELWSKHDATADMPILSRLGGSLAPYGIWINPLGQAQVRIRTASGSHFMYDGTTVINDLLWHHVVATRDSGGTLSIYVNGVLDAQFTGTAAPDTTTMYGLGVGYDGDTRAGFFQADEVAFYSAALTGTQVADHYRAASTLLPISGGSLTLTGSGTVLPQQSSGTLTLSGVMTVAARAGGTGYLELFGDGIAAAVIGTDTTNSLDGLSLVCGGTATVTRPTVTPLGLAVEYDKALPYPQPVMVNGRPT